MSFSLSNMTDFASAVYKSSKHLLLTSSWTLPPGGTGIYTPASYLVHPSLPNHTIYTPHPRNLAPGERLPVLIWANGMGLAWGLMFGPFLREIASHGYVVIASGKPADEADRASAAAGVYEDGNDDEVGEGEDVVEGHEYAVGSGGLDGGGSKQQHGEHGAEEGHSDKAAHATQNVKKAGRKARRSILGAARRGGVGLARLKQVDAEAMLEAVDWVIKATTTTTATTGENKEAGGVESADGSPSPIREFPPGDVRAHIDGSRIALAGQSKGGVDAYIAAATMAARNGGKDKGRLRTVGLFNAGLIKRTAELEAQVRGLEVPMAWIVGGKADLAWRNAKMDWEIVEEEERKRAMEGKEKVPVWMGNLDVGHIGTFYDEDGKGGMFGTAAVDWLAACLKEDEEARRRMVDEYPNRGWDVQARNWV